MAKQLLTLYEFFHKYGYSWAKYPGEIGIEIETESVQPYEPPRFTFWGAHDDQSLRNFGIEYVLAQPLPFLTRLKEALEEFKDKTKDLKFIENSITTSVHVHLNMLNEDIKTLCNFFTTYSLVENILVRFAGENRRSNGFCLPICDAEATYQNIITLLRHIEGKRYTNLGFGEDQVKYSALNIASLGRRGSLEVRLFRGTTDVDLIYTWVRILYRIMEYSRDEERYPNSIIIDLKNKGADILKDIFKEDYKLLTLPEEKELLEKNMFYAANIAFGIKDWPKLITIFSKTPKKPKLNDIDKLSQKTFGQVYENLPNAQQREVMNLMQQDDGVGPAIRNEMGRGRVRIRDFDIHPGQWAIPDPDARGNPGFDED